MLFGFDNFTHNTQHIQLFFKGIGLPHRWIPNWISQIGELQPTCSILQVNKLYTRAGMLSLQSKLLNSTTRILIIVIIIVSIHLDFTRYQRTELTPFSKNQETRAGLSQVICGSHVLSNLLSSDSPAGLVLVTPGLISVPYCFVFSSTN